MGAVPKVRIGDKTLFLSRSRTLKKIFARYDSVTNTGNVSIYDLQKYDLKYGLSFHIKSKGRFKSRLYNAKHHFLSRSQILKYCLLDLMILLSKAVYLHIIYGNM